jgi:hypothetical protein
VSALGKQHHALGKIVDQLAEGAEGGGGRKSALLAAARETKLTQVSSALAKSVSEQKRARGASASEASTEQSAERARTEHRERANSAQSASDKESAGGARASHATHPSPKPFLTPPPTSSSPPSCAATTARG